MRRVNLAAGEKLFDKGDVANEAYLIMDGKIEISSEALTAELGKDELFGESGLVGNTRQAAARAKTDCRLSVEELRGSITSDPDTALTARVDNLGSRHRPTSDRGADPAAGRHVA